VLTRKLWVRPRSGLLCLVSSTKSSVARLATSSRDSVRVEFGVRVGGGGGVRVRVGFRVGVRLSVARLATSRRSTCVPCSTEGFWVGGGLGLGLGLRLGLGPGLGLGLARGAGL